MLKYNKITIVLIAAMMVVTCMGANNRTCDLLRYENQLEDLPDLIMLDAKMQAICRLRSNGTELIHYSSRYGYTKGLTYNSEEHAIYYASNGAEILKTRLSDNRTESFFVLNYDLMQTIGRIENLAYDWIARNIYVHFENAIGVIDSKKPANLKILRSNESMYRSIVVHPTKGYLFLHHSFSLISRMSLDGLHSSVIVNVTEQYQHAVVRIETITLDFQQNRLYWIVSPNDKGIRHSNLDGSDIKTIPMLTYGSSCISSGGNYVYYDKLGFGSTYLKRYEKNKGDDEKFLISNGDDVCVNMIVIHGTTSSKKTSTEKTSTEKISTEKTATEKISNVVQTPSYSANKGCTYSIIYQTIVLFFCISMIV